MWHGKKVAVIFPTYREKKSIKTVIEEFDHSGYVDELIVVDNNAEVGTVEEVKKTRAKIIYENRQGYGHAIRKGLSSTKADLLIVAEPDGTFDGNDVIKLLSYSDDFDLVLGSRTHVSLIHKGSDMTSVKQVLAIWLAKMATWLFFCPLLTDLGCTLRLTNRTAWKRIEKEVKGGDWIFSIKWILVAVMRKTHYIQIPVNFRARVGTSSFVDTFSKKAIWGINEFMYIWYLWIRFKYEKYNRAH